jgi:hypothetical protein
MNGRGWRDAEKSNHPRRSPRLPEPRALAHEKIHDRFMERALARVGAIRPTRSILR